MSGSIMPQWMIMRRQWSMQMENLSPVSREDDTTTEGEEVEEVEAEEVRCQRKLGEAKALIREQNDEISALQGQVDQLQALAAQLQAQAAQLQAQAGRFRADALRNGRLAFHRQVTVGAREQELLTLGAALDQLRRNCHCRGPGPRIRRQRCGPAAQPAVRAPRRAQAPPAPMQRRIGRIAKDAVRRPYPK